MRKKDKRYNAWEIASFVSFGSAALYIFVCVILDKKFSIELPGEYMLLPAAGFAALDTTGALMKGEFFIQHGTCTRSQAPVAFWFSVLMGYLIAIALIGFLISILADNSNEQAIAPNRSQPPTQKSTSSVRGSED